MIRTFRGTTNSWYLNLRAIKLLSESKLLTADEMDKNALNLNIIQNLASAVEGSTRSLLINHVEYSKYNTEVKKNVDLKLKAIIDITLKSLYNAPWGEMNTIGNQLFGVKLRDFYSGEFNSVSNLFYLRNITAHGGIIIHNIDYIPLQPELGFDSEEDKVEYNNKRELTKYLVEKKLMDSHIFKQIGTWEYFNEKITEHFKKISSNFMIELYANYREKYDTCTQIERDSDIVNKYCNR